jgi:hypothetical protein
MIVKEDLTGLFVAGGTMRHFMFSIVTVSAVLLANNVEAQYGAPRTHANTTRGAVIGGAAGAAIGGVIGHQKDKTGKGALIGGAVGALAGAALGNEQDKQVSRQYSYGPGYSTYHGHPVPTRTVYSGQPTYHRSNVHTVRQPVSVSEVVNMTRSGVSDQVIVAHIQSNGVMARPATNDIVFMSQQGVSDAVISAMQGVYNVPIESPVYHYPTYPSAPQPHYHYPSTPAYSTPTYYSAPTYHPIDRRGF